MNIFKITDQKAESRAFFVAGDDYFFVTEQERIQDRTRDANETLNYMLQNQCVSSL